MRGDPAVETAAVALLRGMDPIRFARLSGPELALHLAVLERAHILHGEEMTAYVKAVAAEVGNRVGEIVARAFG